MLWQKGVRPNKKGVLFDFFGCLIFLKTEIGTEGHYLPLPIQSTFLKLLLLSLAHPVVNENLSNDLLLSYNSYFLLLLSVADSQTKAPTPASYLIFFCKKLLWPIRCNFLAG